MVNSKPTKPCAYCGVEFSRQFPSLLKRFACCSNICAQLLRAGDEEKRFWSKVDIRGPNECHPWKGVLSVQGYGHFWVKGRRTMAVAHRLAWIYKKGPIQKGDGYHGTCVCHTCDNRTCVNLAHLFLGSHAENMEDRQRKGRTVVPPAGIGENNAAAKLTSEQVKQIRARKDIARIVALDFGIAKGTVVDIRRRKIWKHVA